MMFRTLLISALLIGAALACAPHSPRRPSRPVRPKECTKALAPWTPLSECKTELNSGGATTYECTPITATATKYTCPDGASPVVYGSFHKILNSITCDPATGRWVYDTDDDLLTDDTLATVAGDDPFVFACAKQ